MKKLDAATLKTIAPGAAMVLLAGPVFLFIAADLVMFFIFVAPRTGYRPQDISTLSTEFVFCGFAALLAAYGARKILRGLKAAP